MEITVEEKTPNEKSDLRKKISWSSIWAGVIVGIVALILLNMLGVGIGFSTLDIQEERYPARGLGMGAAIWYVVSSLIALFLAGWVSGRLAQTRRLFDGTLHGVLTWCIITIASLYFITTTIGAIIGGAGRLVGNTISAAGQFAGSTLQTMGSSLADTYFSEMKDNGNSMEVIDLFKNADGDASKINRNQLANVIVSQTGKSHPEAERTADSLILKYQTASAKWQTSKATLREKSIRTADDITSGASRVFILSFCVFVLGGAAAGWGAKMGTQSKYNPFFNKAVTHT